MLQILFSGVKGRKNKARRSPPWQLRFLSFFHSYYFAMFLLLLTIKLDLGLAVSTCGSLMRFRRLEWVACVKTAPENEISAPRAQHVSYMAYDESCACDKIARATQAFCLMVIHSEKSHPPFAYQFRPASAALSLHLITIFINIYQRL